MNASLFVRDLTAAERRRLKPGLRAREAFTVRRCRILLASAERTPPAEIARSPGCAAGTVRNAPHAFEAEGLACLGEKPSRPKAGRPLPAAAGDDLQVLLHQSPRRFGKPQSTWTPPLLAEVACERGLTPRRLSHEAVRQAVKRLGIGWKRAKRWITSPDPEYARKKTPAIG